MSRRWYFETTPSGKEKYITVKRYKHHHHHHRRHHDHDSYRVSRAEWDRIVERERCLAETNKSLADEVAALKTSLSAAQAEAHHLSHVVVAQLQSQVNVLTADNEALRLSVDNAGNAASRRCHEEERLCQTIERLEREKCCQEKSLAGADKDKAALQSDNADLRERIKCLLRKVDQGCERRMPDLLRDAEYWKEQCRYWKDKFEDTRRRHDDTCGMLEIRTEKMRAYEEILKRRRII